MRGGGPFDEDPGVQGFASGLYTDPNSSTDNGTPAEQKARLLHYQDLIKVGLTGNLADYRFTDTDGKEVTGSEVDYNGAPAGYAAAPGDALAYVDAHDNESLFDALAFKLPAGTSAADRARMQVLAHGHGRPLAGPGARPRRAPTCCAPSRWTATPTTAATGSTPIHWDCADGNGFGRGLPPAADNAVQVAVRQAAVDAPSRSGCAQIDGASAAYRDLLRIRTTETAFSLGTAEQVQSKLSFPLSGKDETPGVITMRLGDLVVVFNATPETQEQRVAALAGTATGCTPCRRRARTLPSSRLVVRAGIGHVRRSGADGGRLHPALTEPALDRPDRRPDRTRHWATMEGDHRRRPQPRSAPLPQITVDYSATSSTDAFDRRASRTRCTPRSPRPPPPELGACKTRFRRVDGAPWSARSGRRTPRRSCTSRIALLPGPHAGDQGALLIQRAVLGSRRGRMSSPLGGVAPLVSAESAATWTPSYRKRWSGSPRGGTAGRQRDQPGDQIAERARRPARPRGSGAAAPPSPRRTPRSPRPAPRSRARAATSSSARGMRRPSSQISAVDSASEIQERTTSSSRARRVRDAADATGSARTRPAVRRR